MKKAETIVIELPLGFMNVAVTQDNHLTANTNDSSRWDTMKIPLPEGKWSILSINGKHVFLHKKEA